MVEKRLKLYLCINSCSLKWQYTNFVDPSRYNQWSIAELHTQYDSACKSSQWQHTQPIQEIYKPQCQSVCLSLISFYLSVMLLLVYKCCYCCCSLQYQNIVLSYFHFCLQRQTTCAFQYAALLGFLKSRVLSISVLH